MNDIRLVATDMDGTLLTSNHQLPAELPHYLDRLEQAGILFVPASGRSLALLRSLLPPHGNTVGYVASNGAAAAIGSELVRARLLQPADYLPMVETALESGGGVPLVCTPTGTYISARANEAEHEFFRGYFQRFYSELVFTNELGSLDVPAEQLTVYYPRHDSAHYLANVLGPRFGSSYSLVASGSEWIDAAQPGLNKAAGLAALGEHLGIAPTQMVAFGDGMNDLEMLGYVGRGYAMENAAPAVTAATSLRAPANDEFGVLRVLDQILAE